MHLEPTAAPALDELHVARALAGGAWDSMAQVRGRGRGSAGVRVRVRARARSRARVGKLCEQPALS